MSVRYSIRNCMPTESVYWYARQLYPINVNVYIGNCESNWQWAVRAGNGVYLETRPRFDACTKRMINLVRRQDVNTKCRRSTTGSVEPSTIDGILIVNVASIKFKTYTATRFESRSKVQKRNWRGFFSRRGNCENVRWSRIFQLPAAGRTLLF